MRYLNDDKGIALVIALMVLLTMTVLGMSIFYSSTVDFKIAGNERAGMVAYYAALAGLQDAGERLAEDIAGMRAAAGVDPKDATDTTWTTTISGALPNGSTYNVNISYAGYYNGASWLVWKDNDYPDCMSYGIGYPVYRITSVGKYVNSTRIFEEVGCMKFLDLFTRAVTTCGEIYISSNTGTDSYDSDSGAYNPGGAGAEGDIFTSGNVYVKGNTTNFKGSVSTPMNVTLDQGADVTGNVAAGGNVSVNHSQGTVTQHVTAGGNVYNIGTIQGNTTAGGSISGGGTFVGTKTPGASVATIDPPEACLPENYLDVPSGISSPGPPPGNNNQNIVCTGCSASCTQVTPATLCTLNSNKTMTLPGGPDANNPTRYYFKGLNQSQNSKIVTTGFVKIYIEGDFTTSSNTLLCGNIPLASCKDSPLPNSDPDQVFIHVYGISTSNPGVNCMIDINSGTKIWGKIYAPTASMTVVDSNSSVYGSMLAGGMCAGCGSGGGIDANSGIHYDVDIRNDNTKADTTRMTKRKECFFGALTSIKDVGNDRYAVGSCKPGPD